MSGPGKSQLVSKQIHVLLQFYLVFSCRHPSIDLVQQGISEKVALVVMFLSAFVTGFVLAYIRNARLAGALTAILPCIGITGAVMNKNVSSYMQYVDIAFLVADKHLTPRLLFLGSLWRSLQRVTVFYPLRHSRVSNILS